MSEKYCRTHPEDTLNCIQQTEFKISEQSEQSKKSKKSKKRIEIHIPDKKRIVDSELLSNESEDYDVHYDTKLFDYNNPDPYTRKQLNRTSKKIEKQKKKFLEKLNISTMEYVHTEEEVLNAILSNAAYTQAFKSKNAALKYVRSKSHLIPALENVEIISEFTDYNYTLFKIGDEYILSLRGSDGDFYSVQSNMESVLRNNKLRIRNAADWGVNLHTLGGNEDNTARFKKGLQVAKDIKKEFNLNRDNFHSTGHSQGGGISDHIAEKLGLKSVSFEPSRNPFAKRYKKGVHPDAEIKSFSTIYDPVSIARHTHERVYGTMDHINHTIISALPGKETGLIDQHDILQHIDGIKLKNGKLVSTRTTPFRNTMSLLTNKGVEGAGFALDIALPIITQEKYDTKFETDYRTDIDIADNILIDAQFFSDSLFKLNPAFLLIDEASMYRGLYDMDPIIAPELADIIREHLGIKSKKKESRFKKSPKFIQKLQTSKRRQEENDLLAIQNIIDDTDVSFDLAVNSYYDGNTISNTSNEPVVQSQSKKYHDVDTSTGFTRGNKKYIEVQD